MRGVQFYKINPYIQNMQKFQKTNTFTIGFNESEHDESKSASEIAKILKTNHTSLIFLEIIISKILKAHYIFVVV